MNRIVTSFVVAAAGLLNSSVALAETTIAQWNFNQAATSNSPWIGAGTLTTAVGGAPLGSFNNDATGSPGDMTPGQSGLVGTQAAFNGFNHSKGLSGPQPTDASGTIGLLFKTSTVGAPGLKVSWHMAQSFRASRFYQLLATADGVNYAPVPAGVGSTASNLGGTALDPWYSSITVSSTGLIDLRVRSGKILAADGLGMGYELAYTFPVDSPYLNTPNFGLKIVAVHDSTANAYVSSFAGTSSADTSTGYVRSAASGGGVRFDLVTVATPEPTTLTVGLAAVGFLARRRK